MDKNARVIVENKVVPFMEHGVYCICILTFTQFTRYIGISCYCYGIVWYNYARHILLLYTKTGNRI